MGDEERTRIEDQFDEHLTMLRDIKPCIEKVNEMHSFLLGDLQNPGYIARQEKRLTGLESGVEALEQAETRRTSSTVVKASGAAAGIIAALEGLKAIFGGHGG